MPRHTLASLKGRVVEPPDPTKIVEEKVGSVDRKMSFPERQSLAYQIEMIERSSKQNLNGEKDDPRVLKKLYQMKMQLAHDDELTFSGNDRTLAEKEMKEIEEILVKEMPSKNEMWPKNDISVKANALRHQQAFEKKYHNQGLDAPPTGNMVLRWQELRRRAFPQDPNAHNLDNIRPDRHAAEAT